MNIIEATEWCAEDPENNIVIDPSGQEVHFDTKNWRLATETKAVDICPRNLYGWKKKKPRWTVCDQDFATKKYREGYKIQTCVENSPWVSAKINCGIFCTLNNTTIICQVHRRWRYTEETR